MLTCACSRGLYVILPGVLPRLASLIPKIAAGHPGDLGFLLVGSSSFSKVLNSYSN